MDYYIHIEKKESLFFYKEYFILKPPAEIDNLYTGFTDLTFHCIMQVFEHSEKTYSGLNYGKHVLTINFRAQKTAIPI